MSSATQAEMDRYMTTGTVCSVVLLSLMAAIIMGFVVVISSNFSLVMRISEAVGVNHISVYTACVLIPLIYLPVLKYNFIQMRKNMELKACEFLRAEEAPQTQDS
jgi:hypothetical protein